MRNFLLGLVLLIPLVASAAPMTNADVIKMVKGGLGDATVLQAIDAAEAGFDTSPDGLVMLKGGGVSDAVIQRVRRLGRRVACFPCCRKHAGGQFDARFQLRETRLG